MLSKKFSRWHFEIIPLLLRKGVGILPIYPFNTALWVKFSADDIWNIFSYFYQKTCFDISCKLSPMETICMKWQILFSGKNKKKIIKVSSAEFAHTVLKVKGQQCVPSMRKWFTQNTQVLLFPHFTPPPPPPPPPPRKDKHTEFCPKY